MEPTPNQNIHAAKEVTEDMSNAKRKSEEELMRELDERDDVLVGVEDSVAESVKEIFPEVRTPHVNLGVIMRKTLLYYHGKYYDIEEYAKECRRVDDESPESRLNDWEREIGTRILVSGGPCRLFRRLGDFNGKIIRKVLERADCIDRGERGPDSLLWRILYDFFLVLDQLILDVSCKIIDVVVFLKSGHSRREIWRLSLRKWEQLREVFAQQVIEELKSGRLNEWADVWVLKKKSPLIV
jgi:hypothetical protein